MSGDRPPEPRPSALPDPAAGEPRKRPRGGIIDERLPPGEAVGFSYLPGFSRLVSPRWAALIALLAAEAIALSLRFDAGSARGDLPELILNLPHLAFQLLVPLASLAI